MFRKKAIIDAEKEANVAKIQFERKIMEKESNQKISEIEDSMHLAKEKSKSDAEYYRVQRVAEANKLLLTPEYIEMKRIESLSNNQKVYFGPDIPTMFVNQKEESQASIAATMPQKVKS